MNKKLLLWQPLALFVGLSGAFSCADAADVTGAVAAPPATSAALANLKVSAPENIAQTTDIAPVWAGHPVGFAFVTRGGYQFVAFYDAERNMTIAQRKLGEKSFQLTRLPTQVGWDSHNYIALDLDAEGYIHVAGNMHVAPNMIYFRSTRPFDASTLRQVPQMIGGTDETRVTYPVFFRGPNESFLFNYRTGISGDGNQIYNAYDLQTRSWHRLLDKPLFDGQGERNAYTSVPTLGPDGYFHIVWIWRETSDAATNHDPSYARSRDLVHWENSHGEPLNLPITLKSGDIIDPIPVNGGAINGNIKLGFDAQKRVIVGYHKYDANGNTQIYNARSENGVWKIYQASDWDYRWDFGGGGTLQFGVRLSGVKLEPNGTLTQDYSNKKLGSGTWILDPQTLKPIGLKPPAALPDYPASLHKVESNWPGMEVHLQKSQGGSGEPNTRYVMRWETLPSNRDKPRPEPYPPASMLRVYELKAGS